MSIIELTSARLPLPVRASERRLAEVHFDEFSVSPVDDVLRAIHAFVDNRRPRVPLIERLVFRQPPTLDQTSVRLLVGVLDDWHTWSGRHSSQEENRAPERTDLDLSGDFSPSKQLTEIWISGLLELGKEAGRAAALGADFEVAQEFSRTLSAVLGTIAQQLRFRDVGSTAITRSGRFTPTYQIALCDAYLIIPDRSPEFLDLLLSEIVTSLRLGCRINGDWGEVVAARESRDLSFSLKKPVFENDPNFEESEEVQ